MRSVLDDSCKENQNTRFLFSNLLFPKIVPFIWEKVEKYYRGGQATDDNIIFLNKAFTVLYDITI
jgi:hypothetical protein